MIKSQIALIFIYFTIITCDKWVRRVRTTEPREISTCYAHLGCVNITHEWFNPSCRKQNLKPQERHVVNTRFLYLNACPNEFTVIVYDVITYNPDSVNVTRYGVAKPLLLLIHDFTSSGYTGWIKHIALVLFKKGPYNIVAVDWQEGAEPPFEQAIANARLVALECETFLKMLELRFGLKMTEVHILGHGVGAHIAGYIGKVVPQIGRITGLDPTGPLFECMPSIAKLNPADALFVDVLHTDGQGYYRQGTMDPMGNLDYYFNDGHDQPGCVVNKAYHRISEVRVGELAKGKVLPGCSHKRSFKYFIEAIPSSQCQFVGFKSSSYEDFLKSGCINCNEKDHVKCAVLNMDTLPTFHLQVNSKMYLQTASMPPFCLNPYLVTLNMGCNENMDKSINGHFNIYMVEEESNMKVNATFNKGVSRAILHGRNESFIAYGSYYGIDRIKELRIKWNHTPRPFCIRCNNNAYLYNMTVTHIRESLDIFPQINNEFCSENGKITTLVNGCPARMKKCKFKKEED